MRPKLVLRAEPAPVAGDDRRLRRARRRFARRAWTRRWVAWRRVLCLLLLVGGVGAAVWLLFFSSVLAVAGVRVAGTGVLAPGEVRRVAAVPTGVPLVRVDLDAISHRVENLAAVESVDVTRSWPDRIRIAVTERTAVAVVDRQGVLLGMDAGGVLFRRYPSRPRSLPLVRTGPDTSATALAEGARVVASLPARVERRVDHVEVRTVDTISLRLRDGRTVLWGSADDSADKARVVAVLLDQQAAYYDVSVPGQPILRR